MPCRVVGLLYWLLLPLQQVKVAKGNKYTRVEIKMFQLSLNLDNEV